MKQPYNTALYMRLSRDDELQGESGSIQTQRLQLRSYAAENGLHVVDEYIDDGWSGTNFDRPAFQRMIEDIEEGKINCVITKDLSRLGRNYILTGQYTDIYFPSKGVRYIAINDNVDTAKGESEMAPFLNILNEMHARQTSKKVKAALQTKYANGAYLSTHAPIGYMKDPNRRGYIIPDPDTRWIVEHLFELAARGMGANRIRQTLFEEKVPCPSWLNYQKYGTYAHVYENAPEEKHYTWDLRHIKKILTNEVYIGNSIHNKCGTVSFKNKCRVNRPPEEWVRVEHAHEAIIPEDVFWQVQEQIGNRRRTRKNGTIQIFSGLVKCADCGRSLAYSGDTPTGKHGWFSCAKYREGLHECTAHSIHYDSLYAFVLARLQYWAQCVHTDQAQVLQQLMGSTDKARAAQQKKQAADLRQAERRKAEIDSLFMKVYEDRAAGRITEYNFAMMSGKYQAEQTALDEQIGRLKEAMNTASQTETDAAKWLVLMQQYANPTELTVELLNALIEKIVVHEAVKEPDGTIQQEVEIYYRFIGRLE